MRPPRGQIARFVLIVMTTALCGWTVMTAMAFSGEDVLLGRPWYHQVLTEAAALRTGFTQAAASSLKWHADYIDSYNYNPLWWADGGPSRLKVSLATHDELSKLHFDDLFSTHAVSANWHRILSGTLVGLLWAKENNDVAAAHNILGISLHAIQDFYAHSNWVDDPARRTRTWFDVPPAERNRMSIWTGSYERPPHVGVKPHGKIEPAASILTLKPVAEIMPVVCSPFSPMSNSGLCEQWRSVRDAQTVEQQVLGVKVPRNVVYLSPPGIALDNKWVSNIAVQVRGVTDVTGEQLFQTALDLAEKTSVQWLLILEREMKALGAEQFWQSIKTTGFDLPDRTRQFEDYKRLPYTFLTAGAYPTPPFAPEDHEQIFLRVRLKTASDAMAGTDADIILEADTDKFLLDYMPRANPVLAVNDFEAGDDMVYTVGPVRRLPEAITLHNRAATGWDVLVSLKDTFVQYLERTLDNARKFLLSLIGGNADHIATSRKLWSSEELARVGGAGETFSISADGGGEGKYTVHGTIRKIREGTGSHGDWAEYQVTLTRLQCNSESKWDRGSDSDEPFVLAVLVPLPGDIQKYRTSPYNDVDSGESRQIDHSFQTVRIYKGSGMLSVAVSVWESDDESGDDRDQLLNRFAAQVDESTGIPRRQFLDTLGAAIAADWKLARVEVYAFSRSGTLQGGKVLDATVNRWIPAGKKASFRVSRSALRDWGVPTHRLETPPSFVPAPAKMRSLEAP